MATFKAKNKIKENSSISQEYIKEKCDKKIVWGRSSQKLFIKKRGIPSAYADIEFFKSICISALLAKTEYKCNNVYMFFFLFKNLVVKWKKERKKEENEIEEEIEKNSITQCVVRISCSCLYEVEKYTINEFQVHGWCVWRNEMK